MQLFGSGLLVDGGRYVEYFFQQWNRVRVQEVGVGRREGLRRLRREGSSPCRDNTILCNHLMVTQVRSKCCIYLALLEI